MLRYVIDQSCLLFAGSGQHKYANEMLCFQKLFTSSASPILQRAILANGLVNFRGHEDSWFETDRMVEFHIGDMKEAFKAKRGSSIDLEYLFQYCSLNSSSFCELNKRIEKTFGVHVGSEHTTKSARYDITCMAERLVRQSSLVYTKGRTVKFIAADFIREGAIKLAAERIEGFNNKELHNLPDDNESGELQTDDLPEDFYQARELED
jgi:hypothetical protein